MTPDRDIWREDDSVEPTLVKPPRCHRDHDAHRIRNEDLPPSLLAQMEGRRPPDDYESNGCSFSPDYIGYHDLRPACHFHDYAYDRGGDEGDREAGDYEFARNLQRCGLGHVLTGTYFRRVRFEGIGLFKHDDPPRRWALWRLRLWVFFSRWLRF